MDSKNHIKEQAYQLHLLGKSYGEIAKELGIGKTTAFDYVKEVEWNLNKNPEPPVRNSSEPDPNTKVIKTIDPKVIGDIINRRQPPKEEKVKNEPKTFTGDDLLKKVFDCLEFEGKFLELIGRPSRIFSALVWGLPKGGKSNLSIRFADYLQEHWGDVIYFAAEEGESLTLQEKIRDIGGSRMTFIETKDREVVRDFTKSSSAEFVFIDSINNAQIDNDYLELIKEENPDKSFIVIVQATKGGNFKGDQALEHNCDFVIKVVEGVAHQKGRFNTCSQVDIFGEPLYQKNPNYEKRKAKQNKPSIKKPADLPPSVLKILERVNLPVPPTKPIETEKQGINLDTEAVRNLIKKLYANPVKPTVVNPTTSINKTFKSGKGIGSFVLAVCTLLLAHELTKPKKDDPKADSNSENTTVE